MIEDGRSREQEEKEKWTFQRSKKECKDFRRNVRKKVGDRCRNDEKNEG